MQFGKESKSGKRTSPVLSPVLLGNGRELKKEN